MSCSGRIAIRGNARTLSIVCFEGWQQEVMVQSGEHGRSEFTLPV